VSAPPPSIETALARFDAENARDPKQIEHGDETRPYELFYAQEVTKWVQRLCPEPSAALRLAARCQHLCRWEIPRASYEMTRAGYLKWRADLKKLHAQKSGEILAELGFPVELIERVQALNLKRELGRDAEMQVLEDALCLVTLEHQLDELVARTEPEKMVGILQKTWRKMSPKAHEAALQLEYRPEAKALLGRALGGESAS
jgi:hypothetical protein